MKKLLLSFAALWSAYNVSAQCTTVNATSCQCQNSSQTNCDLLPDITISWLGVSNGGYIEYSQTSTDQTYSQGPNAGRLRVTGSTPNIGHGSLTVRGVDSLGYRHFDCGGQTFSIYDPNSTTQFTCPNGDPNPHQVIFQRVYHKNGSTMTYNEVEAGTMTYHPTHGHNHVDDWGVFTLRIDNGDPNPLNWPIVGQGQKMGFCLMDYGQCGTNSASTYYGHCRDDNTIYNQGNILINSDFPNWGLGGGQYNCSQIEQGISSGWTDVYGKHLDGMWINIPNGTCNGSYYIVVEIDPNHNFLEENDNNNFTAVPVTLSQQTSSNPIISLSADRTPVICPGENITLTATAGTSFLWNTGDTTQNIVVNQPGTYNCTVTTFCGSGSASFTVYTAPAPAAPTAANDTVCINSSAVLTASGTGTLVWRDGQGNMLGSGSTFTTPALTANTTFYVEDQQSHSDTTNMQPYNSNLGSGGFVTSSQYEIFNVYSACTLLSVEVEAQAAGNRTIELRDSNNTVLQSATVNLPAGISTVTLNFPLSVGNNYRLACAGTPNLYRNNGGVSYPYDLPGVVRITNSSNGLASYYFFYNWKLATTNQTCTSPATAVTVTVDPCLGLGEHFGFQNSLKLVPNPSNGQFSIQFNAYSKTSVYAYVTDLAGRIVHTENFGTVQGNVSRDLNLTNLSKGTYLLNVMYEGNPYATRLVIQ